jgi:hypothetical protein
MARCKDLRDGTAELQYDEYTATTPNEDGTPFTYKLPRQPMPTRKIKQEPLPAIFTATKRVSKHYKGWTASASDSPEQRRLRRQTAKRARKLGRAAAIAHRKSRQQKKSNA